jgi:DNA excision repair protein ERCC-2
MFRRDAFTRPAVEELARHHRVCPFEFSLELSLWADCIICDYNYAFDPRVFLRRFFLEEKGRYTFLIDEAHNLVDRSREMFSAEIFKQSFLDVRRAVGKKLAGVYRSCGRINTWMLRARKKYTTTSTQHHERQLPEDLIPLLRAFLKTTERWLADNSKAEFREQLLELFFAVSGFMRVAEHYDDTYATCFEKVKKDLRLKLFCIDPSVQLAEALTRCQAAVFFSATMTPMAYFQKILGCRKEAGRLALPSPFPPQNLALFVSDRVSTLFRHRQQTCRLVREAICTLVRQKKGNYLIFFPSYEYLQMVAASFETDCPGNEVMVQTPHMGEAQRVRESLEDVQTRIIRSML